MQTNIISVYPDYLRHFTRDGYPAAFKKYKTESSGFFEELSDGNIDSAITQLMDFAANELSRKFGRKTKCFDLRCFMCVYLCPAALDYGTEAARKFAYSLADKWSKAYPDFGFEAGRYDDIASGFRTKPFGF